MVSTMTATEAMALAAVDRDQDVGTAKQWKGCIAEIVAGTDGVQHRKVVASRGDAEQFVLTRCPPGDPRAELADLELPDIPGTAVWWGAAEKRRVVAWVALADEQAVAAAIVAYSVCNGWSADQMLPLGNPLPQLMTMHRGTRQRIVSAVTRQVILVEMEAQA